MMAKGRYGRTGGGQNAKLTPEQVQEIRALRGIQRQKDIAARFGVAQSVISDVQRGVSYRA